MRWQTYRMTEYEFSRNDPCRCLFYSVHDALDFGSCSNDHLSWTRLSKSNARRCRNTSWLARSTIPFSSLEYAVAKDCSKPHRRTSSVTNSLWKAGPWSVWMTSGDPNRPTWLSIMDAVSAAVVDLVGNNSTHLENASMITRIYSWPSASLVSGPIWSRWSTSKGLYKAQVNRWALIWSHHLTCWALSNELWYHAISDISPPLSLMSNPQWPTLELWTLDNRAWMSDGSTMTGQRATMRRSAKLGGGGTWFVQSLDNASGTNCCSSLPGTWNKSKSLSCKQSFHRKTLPVNVTLIYVRFLWSVFRMKHLLSNRSSKSFTP